MTVARIEYRLPGTVARWPLRWREDFEERAGILEYEAGLDRAEAERQAEAIVRAECDAETRRMVEGNRRK